MASFVFGASSANRPARPWRRILRRLLSITAAWILAALGSSCSEGGRDLPVLTSDMPLHLEDHLDAATITGSEVPANPPATVEWRFEEAQDDWKATPLWNPPFGEPTLERTSDALRITLMDRSRSTGEIPVAGIHVDVPDWDRCDWADVVIRARADSTRRPPVSIQP